MRRPTPHPDHEDQELDTRLIWAGLFFSLAVFAKFPQIDLIVAANYYQTGAGFIHRQDPMVLWLYNWTPWLGRALVLALALFWAFNGFIASWLTRRGQLDRANRCRGPWRHLAVVAVVACLLGPGLLIEGVFKNVAGRPRPVQVLELGGTEPFHGAFEWGAHPDRHKSFVSSHAAGGFALMSLGLTCGPLWRRRWLLISIVYGGVIGLGRMMQGGHFLSDIVFAFYAVWLSCEAVRVWDQRRQTRISST
ncbi:MAG: phosphatase PAP2 family protein [Acidobacteriota bacterium]